MHSFRVCHHLVLCSLLAASAPWSMAEAPASGRKIGVLLVNHGSRSASWRNSLLELEKSVRPALMKNPAVKGLSTAFMEYTEPSIATRMKEFDAGGFTHVVIVPLFLTVSSHTFDDIPTIIGRKVDSHSLEMMKLEKIERYSPKAAVEIAPNLDFAGVLKKNVLRRLRNLSTNPADEGLVLIAYGDTTYEKQWAALLAGVADHVKEETGINAYAHGWCGHVARYDPAKTTEAIARVLESKKKALVVPVLVAHDEMFQVKIIGDGIAKIPDSRSRVSYRPDAILPDRNIEDWVVRIAGKLASKIEAAPEAGTSGE